MNKKAKENKIIFLSSLILIFILSSAIIISLAKRKDIQEKKENTQTAKNGCIISGCNNEICQSKDEESAFSVCLYKPEYECYKLATCERQSNGECGWSETEEFKACLEKYQ